MTFFSQYGIFYVIYLRHTFIFEISLCYNFKVSCRRLSCFKLRIKVTAAVGGKRTDLFILSFAVKN